MAAPNIVGVTTITGKTSVLAITNSATAIVSNPGGSNKVFKVNALYVANVDGVTNFTLNVDILRSSVAYRLAHLLVVPAGATIDVISKSIYLEEGDSLRLTGSTTLKLEGIASYEEIS
jgi:hypothetical protein